MPLTVRGGTPGILCVLGTDARSGEHQVGQQRLAVSGGRSNQTGFIQLEPTEQTTRTGDPLTGLLNRRFLEETLARDVYRAQRRNSPLCVAMLDLDDFKQFNDTFGHDAGDSLLRELGRVIREKLRKSDILCRYGGDEFVLVLSDSPLPDAKKRVEQICAMVKEMQSDQAEPRPDAMTISAGIAQAGVDASNPAELLRAADNALYAAKTAGRDRVAVYQAKES